MYKLMKEGNIIDKETFYKIKNNIRKGDIVKILNKAFIYLDDNNYEYNSAHQGNKDFKVENDIALEEIPTIVKSLQVNDFCHKEIDREYPVETLYCFKLFIEENENLNDTLIKICDEEILVKFKFRETTKGDLFIMSLHYPNPEKEPWTWIWR